MSLKLCVALLLWAIQLTTVRAQGYNTALGLRVGSAAGISLVQRVGNHVSVEAFAVNRFLTDAYTLTLVGRRHIPLVLKRVNVFVGAGLHKGWNYEDRTRRGNPFGFDIQAGAEVAFGRINVSYDFVPQINVTGGVFPFRLTSAVGLRYVIDKRSPSGVKMPWVDQREHDRRVKERQSERKDRRRERTKRKRREERGKRRGERPTLRERLGLDPKPGA